MHRRHAWTIPNVLRLPASEEPENLNPLLYGDQPTLNLSMFIYSWAIRFDAHARPFPDALREVPTVANGDVSRDGLTLKYKLRRNIRWQDGPQLTCRDLRFTWRAVMNPHNNVETTEGYRDIRDIGCSDPYVAVIRMKRVYAPFLQQFWAINGYAPILPEHILGKYNDSKGSLNRAPYNALPIGSGPFKVVWWRRNQEIRMVANANFYLGKPKLDQVIVPIFVDRSTELMELRAHNVDFLWGNGTEWPQIRPLLENPKTGLHMVPDDFFAWDHLDFNLNRPIVGDRNVRLALAYASDRDQINAKVEHGWTIRADADQHPLYSWAYTRDITRYDYDPQRARAILDADGWRVGPSGIRVKNGRPLEITFDAIAFDTVGRLEQILFQREWRDVGVQADLKTYPQALFFDNTSAGVLRGGHFDVASSGMSVGPDPDHSDIYSGDELAPRGSNSTRWNNRVATAAMQDALQTVDQRRRRHDYIVVQQLMTRDVPTIFVNFVRVPFVYNDDLHGFDPSPVIPPFWDPWNYSI